MSLNHGLVYLLATGLVFSMNQGVASNPWILRFAEEPADTRFAHTQWGVLKCQVAANPPASVTWRIARTHTVVTNITGLRYVMANGSLVFPPFSAERLDPRVHQIDYQCLAKNRLGALISRAAKLRAVVVRPFRVFAMDSKVIHGNTAVIKTVVPDYARSYVSVKAWYHDRNVVPLGGRYSVMPSGDLVITNVIPRDEASMYHWTAVNTLTDETQASNPAKLTVIPSSRSSPPHMTSQAYNLTKTEGETAVLQCTAAGSPTPHFRWLKDDKPLTIGGRLSIIAGGSLRIERTVASDEAMYACNAINTDGAAVMTIALEILVPITFIERPKPQAAEVGFPRKNMECEVRGEPTPKVTWYQNAESLGEPKGRISIRDNDLVIATVYGQDNGVYQCVADNGLELVQSSAEFYAGFSVPVFKLEKSVILYPGTPLQISCEVSAIPTPRDVQWFHDGGLLHAGQGYIITGMPGQERNSRVSKLSRTAVTMADSGEYKCVASNAAGSAGQLINVYVRGPPNITTYKRSATGVQGETIHLPCRAKGFPPPMITWSKAGNRIPYDRRHTLDNGTLIISNVQKSDTGRYLCTAVNTDGKRDTVTVSVSIVVSPRITPFKWAPVDEGQREYYTCVVADGDMPCNITWLRDGRALHSIPGDLEIMSTMFTSSLSIPQVLQRHEGTYACIVGNRAGIAKHSADLVVYVPSRFVTEPRDQQVLREHTTYLTCHTTGYPPARVEWSKLLGSSFVPLGDNPRFQQLLNGTLVIRNASKKDEGRYSCHAYNGVVGTPVSRQVNLVVHAVPAVIVSPPVDRSVEVLGEVAFSCVAIGNLPIMLKWYNRSKQLVDTSRVQIMHYTRDNAHLVNGTLHVSDLKLWDTKQYSCRVGNQFGEDKKTFKITVQESPSHPSKPTASLVSSKSVQLTWIPGFDGNAYIQKYIIQYKLTTNDWLISEKREVLGRASTYLLTGLKPATSYHIRVFARNAIGTSQPGGAVKVRTKEDAPSRPPKVLNITAISSTEVYVEWQAPPREHRNGVIRGYYVSYSQPNRAKVFYNITVKGGATTSYVITKLEKFSEYEVGLQAFTRAGPSSRTRRQTVKTMEDVPSQPAQFVKITVLGSQSILVTWKRPPYDSIHGILRGYKIQYYRVSHPRDIRKATVQRSQLNVTLRKLGKFTSYRVSVSAFTSVGDGVPSAEMKVKTAEDIPGSPSNVRAIPVSRKRIRVRWNQPIEPNGIIREYRVLYSKVVSRPLTNDTSELVHMVKTNNSNMTSVYLNDLESDTVYYFWVRARTSVGIGNASEVVSKQTMDKITASIFDRTLPDTMNKWKTSAILNCEAYGSPKPTIFWYSRGKDLTDSGKYIHFSNGSLKIMNLDKTDTGKYMCTASNQLGKQTVLRRLRVQIPPSPPKDISFNSVGRPSAVNISWTAGFDGYSQITMFLLEHKAKGEAWKGVYISHTLCCYYILHDINHNRPYYFRMSAINAVGTGKPAKILKVLFAAEGSISSVRQVDSDEELADAGGGSGRFYNDPAIMGTLVTVSLLIVIVVLLLVACRLKRITLKIPKDLRDLWEKAILPHPSQRSSDDRCTPIDHDGTGDEGNGEGGDTESHSPSSDGHLADSSSSIEQMTSLRGSQFSLPRSNGLLHHNLTHEPIMEEPFPPPPPPYHTGSPMLAFPPPPSTHDDNTSDTSSEISFGGQVYHRPMLHEFEGSARARRYPASTSFDSYPTPLPPHPAGARSLTGTPGVNILGMRGPADGGSELDTTSLAARGLESNADLRKLFGSHYGHHGKSREYSTETPHSVYARTPASGISRVPDSAFGSRYEIGRRSAASRRGSTASQKVGPMTKPVIIHPEAFMAPMGGPHDVRRDSASSKESSTYPVDFDKALALRDPRDIAREIRDTRAYDSTSSEYSSSRDELFSALEYGKRHNFEKFYGIPTLETTSISSEATNSSEQDGICKFCTSPRPINDVCLAPVPIRQPPYNPRSRSRGNDAYLYVINPRRRPMEGGVRVQPQTEHKGSLV